MARDETRDVGISSDSLEVRMWSQVDDESRFARYVQHSDLVDLERQFAEREAALEVQRSMLAGSVDSAFEIQPVMSHEELCLTVERETSSRRMEYASELTKLRSHIAERDSQMQTFIRKASEVPGLSATLDEVTWERDQLRKTLADRDDAIREAMALIESDYEDDAYNRLAEALEKP